MAGPENGVPEGVPSRGETAALVEAEQLDPRRQAEQDVAEAEARMREWVRARQTYEARTSRGGEADISISNFFALHAHAARSPSRGSDQYPSG